MLPGNGMVCCIALQEESGTLSGRKKMAKKNPILEAFEAKLEAQYQLRLAHNSEISMLGLIISADDEGIEDVGGLLFRYIETKMQIATDIVSDSKDDKTLTYTMCDLARRVKQILSEEDWERYKELFPLLEEYW
jgi:hypothetical protein